MYSVKPGRGPSIMGGVFCIIFSIVAIAMASAAGSSGAPGIFVLVPGLFVVVGIGGAIYNFYNAGAKERMSEVDIVHHTEEGDPIARALGREPKRPEAAGATEPKPRRFEGEFCPFCGAKVEPSFDYCPKCGKDV